MPSRDDAAREPRDVKREVLSKEAEAMAREYFVRRCARYASAVGAVGDRVDEFADEAINLARYFDARLAVERAS